MNFEAPFFSQLMLLLPAGQRVECRIFIHIYTVNLLDLVNHIIKTGRATRWQFFTNKVPLKKAVSSITQRIVGSSVHWKWAFGVSWS